MLTIAIIVFREVLEAALVVGLVLVGARGLAGRHRWVFWGLASGVVGAAVIAALTSRISQMAAGMGQELFNSVVLLLAAAMLGWHSIWMSRQGRTMARDIKRVGAEVAAGEKEPYVLAAIVMLAVLREGSEVILFIYGLLTAGSAGVADLWTGGVLGLIGGTAMGAALYFGIGRIPARHLFRVTNVLLILLAAGMSSQAAVFLSQAGYLPSFGHAIWNSNWLIPDRSIAGRVLHALVGYTATPTGMQLVFYSVTLTLLAGLAWAANRSSRKSNSAATALGTVTAIVAMVLILAPVREARAEFKVYSPYVVQGELELETRGITSMDKNREIDGNKTFIYEISYTPTARWYTAALLEQSQEHEQGKNNNLRLDAAAWENILMLTEPGQYWLDAAVYLEYEKGLKAADAHELEGKLLLEKTLGRWLFTANPIFVRPIGGDEHGVRFEYAWATRYRLRPELEPGFEAFGEIGRIDAADNLSEQVHQIGPDIRGAFRLGTGKLLYNVGYLLGATDAAPSGAFKFELEYELYF